MSGGVASNHYLRSKLQELTQHYQLAFHAPPPKLCTDNGIMIAWAGIERLIAMESMQLPERDQKGAGSQEAEPSGMSPNTRTQKGAGLELAKEVCWSDMEKESILPVPQLPLGKDLSRQVEAKRIKVKQNLSKTEKKYILTYVQ